MGYGRYLEEFTVGDVYRHWPGRTITEHDDTWFSLMTMNQHPLHIDAHYAASTQHGQRLVNGTLVEYPDGSRPLAPFTAQRVDYSLARLSHYTATAAEQFQNYVLFTNYQFYVEEFEKVGEAVKKDGKALLEPCIYKKR